MAFKLSIIFCAIAAQTLGAPKPCYTNCATSGSTYSHEAIAGMSTHGNFMAQQNSAFQQLHQSLMNQLQEAHHLDYSQPGTWHKNAAFKTDDGGQVYQEHGKVETDNAQMRYFKKNYTNSWGTGSGLNSGAISNDLLNTHGRLTGGGYSGGSAHHEEHHQNWEINSNGHQAQNIEDLGVQQVQTTQVSENVIRNFEENARNLANYINQCTERVQMGQLSNYQSYTDVVQQHLDQMKQAIRDNGLWSRLIGQINSLETQLNDLKVQAQHSANLIHTGSSSSHGSNTLITSGVHQPVVSQGPVGGSSISQNEEYKKHVSIASNSHSVPVQTIPAHSQQYGSGTSGGYQQSYQYGSHGQTGYATSNQDVTSGASQHADYTQHAGYGQDGRYTQQAGGYTHQGTQQGSGYTHGNAGYTQGHAGYTQGTAGYNQHNAGYNQHGGGYNQHTEQLYPVHTSPTKTVEENWNSSGSRKETHYGSTHISEPLRSRCRGSDGQYNTWCASNSGQTESLNFGSQGSGCHGAAYGTLCKRYKREYKDDYSQQTEDLTQQTEDLTQQTEDLTQQTEDLTQQTEDLTQQTEDLSQHIGNLQVGNQRRDQGGYGQGVIDYNQQQQTGGIEFGSQYDQRQNRHENHGRVHGHEQHGHNDGDQGDYTQQTQGSDNLTQQHQHHGHGVHGHEQHGHNDGDQGQHGHGVHGHEQHGHNDGDQRYTQQSQGIGGFSQQQTGGLEFESQQQQHGHHGRVHGHEQHGHNDGDQGGHGSGVHDHEQHGHNDGDYRYNQQGGRSDYSQQQQGNLQLGQQQVQQDGGFEFGQQRRRHQGGYTQQTEDLSQQTQGFEDLTQQTQSAGDYTQQTEDLTQQTQGFEDLTQQHTTGGLQFGEHQVGNQRGNSGHYGGYSQQTEDLSQQTQSFGDLTQQTTGPRGFEQQQTGNLEFGHQQHDLSQQTQGFDDLTQQHTTGDLQLGQQQVGNQRGNSDHYGGYSQQTEDLSQQTQSFGDLTQQTTGPRGFEQQQTGNLEFGHQQHDFSQQTQGFDDLTQQHTTGGLQFGEHQVGNQRGNSGHYGGYSQQTEDLSQQTQSFGDLTQQTTGPRGFDQQQTGNLEFGHQHHDLSQQTQGFDDLTQQSGHLQLGNERPAPKPPARGQIRNSENGNTAAQDTPMSPVKGGRRRPAQLNTYPQQIQNSEAPGVIPLEDQLQQTNANQWHNSHQLSDLTNENYQQGKPLDGSQIPQTSSNQQNSTDTQLQFQPRILEAYGGKGPYDVNHNDNIFIGVQPNPTATLAPTYDSWDIREKPNEIANRNTNYPTFAGAPDRAPRYDWEDTTTTTTPAPGFWKRVGNKITTTYEKTKEKISSSLG